MNTPSFALLLERIDDLLLMLAFLKRLHVDTLLEKAVGTHGNTRHTNVLTNGQALLVWLAFLLTQGDHRKVSVADWVARYPRTLARGVGVPVVPASDFSDDRLSTLLDRLQRPGTWEAVEALFLGRTLQVYALPLDQIHLDSTSTWGFHAPDPDGVMRFGYAKGGCAARTQVKVMAAATRTGQLVACTVWPGDAADPPLYLPLIERVRRLLGRHGLLYVGDSKLATLATRADLAAQDDFYLTPLGAPNKDADPAVWLDRPLPPGMATQLIWRRTGPGEQDLVLLGGVLEYPCPRTVTVNGQPVEWEERVLLVYALTSAAQQEITLQHHLEEACGQIRRLTPPRKPGQTQFTEDEKLTQAIATAQRQAHVPGLLTATFAWEEGTKRQSGRYSITGVTVDDGALLIHRQSQGWRVLVTNAPTTRLTAPQAVLVYREEYVIERDFHLLKDAPVGISPLYVQTPTQITGLTYFLTLGVRVLTLMEFEIAEGLKALGKPLTGLYVGLPKKAASQPTAVRVLQAFVRQEITLCGMQVGEQMTWHITPLSPLLITLLTLLHFPEDLYLRLTLD